MTSTRSMISPGGVGFRFTHRLMTGGGVGSRIRSHILLGGETRHGKGPHGPAGGGGSAYPQVIFINTLFF